MKNKVSLKNFVTKRTSLENETKNKKEVNNIATYMTPIEDNLSFNQFNDKFVNITSSSYDLQNAFSFNENPVLKYDFENNQMQLNMNVCNDYMSIIEEIENGTLPLIKSNSLEVMIDMFQNMFLNRVVNLLYSMDSSIISIIHAAINNLKELGIFNEVNKVCNIVYNIGYLRRLADSILDKRGCKNDNIPDMTCIGNIVYMAHLYGSNKTPIEYITIALCSSINNELLSMRNPVKGDYYINYINSIINNCHSIIFNALTRLAYEAYLLVDHINKSQYND